MIIERDLDTGEYEIQQFTDEQLLVMIDTVFPYKDKNGLPSYRNGQRSVILRIIRACMDKKKFVILDAPVGSGKSVIIYTALKILGPSVYLTPQTQLQDQILNENWKDVTSVKGKSNYSCNYVSSKQDIVRCTYDGDDYETCNNSDQKYAPLPGDIDKLKSNARAVINYHKDNRANILLHSSCENYADFVQLVENVEDDDDIDSKNRALTKIGCTKVPCECVYKSVRAKAKYSGVRVLTPDIYHLLGRYSTIFDNSVVMAIDECHTMENTIQRMFRTKIPVQTIKSIFGLDLSPLLKQNGPINFMIEFRKIYNNKISPMTICMSIMHNMGDLIGVKSASGFMSIKNESGYASALKTDISVNMHGIKINVFDAVIRLFAGEDVLEMYPMMSNFIQYVYNQFDAQKLHQGLDKGVFCDLRENITASTVFIKKHMPHDTKIDIDRQSAAMLSILLKIFESWNDTIFSIANIKHTDAEGKEYPVFTIDISNEHSIASCCEIKHLSGLSRRLYFNNTFHKEDVISVIPVNMAVIMNFFFYGRFSTSIMSTGTWVDLEGKKRIYGINGSCEYIKVPSTFNKSRRPVFVLDNKRYTDFSEKNPDGKGYVYQTDAGTDKFLKELQHTITEIRSLIEKNDGCKDINIIIHCHTFDIAKRIAERGFIDHKYLIHLGDKYGNSIQNCNYGIVELFKKTEILDKFSSRPDSGLVIVSPSINEGVDFKHGIARAQIVIKNPIPYLGDMYVKTIKDGNDELGIKSDRGFIEREVFTTTVQQYGRIMRAEDDWGYTFIIDQSMSYRIKAMLTPQSKWRLKNMNIDYFLEGINYTSRIGGPIIFHWPLNKMY